MRQMIELANRENNYLYRLSFGKQRLGVFPSYQMAVSVAENHARSFPPTRLNCSDIGETSIVYKIDTLKVINETTNRKIRSETYTAIVAMKR